VITYRSDSHWGTRRQLLLHGFLPHVAGLGAVEMAPSEMWGRSPLLLERFAAEGKRLVGEGAELIVCHGMSMSPIEYPAAELTEAVGVPVLEGMGCAVALAEAWVRLGTPYSRVRYPGG
jgi:allantoin racemase